MEEFEDWLKCIVGVGRGRNQPNGRSIICEITSSNHTHVSVESLCPGFLFFKRGYLVYLQT